MDEMGEDTASIAVLSTKMDHVTKTVEEIKTTLATSSSVHVTRSEWELRNQTVDERFVHHHNGQEQLRTEMNARKAPWWTVVAAIGSIIAVLGLALQWVPNIVN
ncbi:hypothetical protein SEA_FEDE_39 [Microbacterium phage Fede]|nr:hypothetical protein SEA_FEDE_39 [Microbacterium phage Fede]